MKAGGDLYHKQKQLENAQLELEQEKKKLQFKRIDSNLSAMRGAAFQEPEEVELASPAPDRPPAEKDSCADVRAMEKQFIWLLRLSGLPLLIVVLFLAFMTVSDYRPGAALESGHRSTTGPSILRKGLPLSVLTFNIGYCGLDAAEDFFMDGGTRSRSRSRRQTLANLEQITRFLTGARAGPAVVAGSGPRASRSHRVDESARPAGQFTRAIRRRFCRQLQGAVGAGAAAHGPWAR